MKYIICLLVVLLLGACKLTKNTSSNTDNDPAGPPSDEDTLQFDCYYSSDTLANLVAYFPEEKIFYLNNKQTEKEDICDVIQNSIALNKGVKHYYHPQSNFLFLISIQRAIKACYQQKIDEISQTKFGAPYDSLNDNQKMSIDKILSYRVVSE